jgi:hypothetical protein
MLLAANLEGHQRRRKAGPDIDLLVSGANQIGGADRRQEHQRECARFKPGKSAIPVLLWPDQLQVVSSVETNGSSVARQSLLQRDAAIQIARHHP